MKNNLLLLFLCICFLACKKHEIPSDVLPLSKMSVLIADIQEAEVKMTLYSNSDPYVMRVLTKNTYDSLFLRHKISEKEFEYSYRFYTSNQYEFKQLYEQVIDELNKRQ